MIRRPVALTILFVVLCAGCGKNSSELAQLGESALQKKDYNSAIDLYGQAIRKARDPGEETKLQSRVIHIQKLQGSREAYNSGVGHFQDKDYAAAYDDFARVASGSEYFEEAKNKVKMSAKYASTSAISKAEDERKRGDIAWAISILRDAKKYGNPTIPPLLEQYKLEYRTALLSKARKLYAAGSYQEAVATLRKAAELGSTEASHLLPRYEATRQRVEEQERLRQERLEKKRAEEQARSERRQAKEQARYYEGDGAVQIAIGNVELHRSTELHTANRDSTYVYVYVSAKNGGDEIVHVNPNDFTLADSNGNTASHYSDTYSLSNYFDAVDLRPGQSTSGWIIFLMLKDNRYELGYQGYGGSAEKDIIP